MEQYQWDGILISKSENQFYLSGFTGEGLMLISHQQAALITDFRYGQQAKSEAPDFEVIDLKNGKSHLSTASDLIKKLEISNLAIESHHLTVKALTDLRSLLSAINVSSIKISETSGIIEDMRSIKGQREIQTIKKAQEITDKTFVHILDFIKPGISEIDITCEIEYYMKKNGAQGPAFKPIVVSGLRSSLPHGEPTSKKLVPGDFITLDFGARYDYYCSDMTRTIFLGKPTSKQVQIYNIVIEAQKRAIDSIKPGFLSNEIDKVARSLIEENGFGDFFGHGLGHGVGIEVHENPKLSHKSETKLEPGMVITVEPGIYIENFGGVRIEDMVIVTFDGCVNLTHSSKDLIYL
jgi:Xaa-Pro aminopeptidase